MAAEIKGNQVEAVIQVQFCFDDGLVIILVRSTSSCTICLLTKLMLQILLTSQRAHVCHLSGKLV